jgi:Tol biopolymer transport system component
MKRCPRCEEVYADDSLRFCRNDGAVLRLVTAEDKRTLIKLPALADTAPTTDPLAQPPTLPRLSQLTFAEAIEEYPAWSANGAEIAFSREEAGIRSIFVKNLASGHERRLTSSDSDDIQPAWTPDARSI